MKGIIFIIIRLLKMGPKKIGESVNTVAARSGRMRLRIFFDMAWCSLRYGAGMNDYLMYGFETLPSRLRKTYLTRGINNRLVKKYNNPRYRDDIDDKSSFLRIFGEYAGRDWLRLEKGEYTRFAEFCEKHTIFIAKPSKGCCGEGIQKINMKEYLSCDALMDKLLSEGIDLAEEYVVQHEALSRLYPDSVNTLRLVTLRSDAKSEVLFAVLRMGGGDNTVVDNLNSGGIAAAVDMESGCVWSAGAGRDGKTYEAHPITGSLIPGFEIPYYREAADMCLKASMVIPQVGYVGWDVAITGGVPLLLEGNPYPGHELIQLPAHLKNRIGLASRVKKYL